MSKRIGMKKEKKGGGDGGVPLCVCVVVCFSLRPLIIRTGNQNLLR